MFLFFVFTACALLLFITGLQIWLNMNNDFSQKKSGKKSVLTRYQMLLSGLLLLFLCLGSCATSYSSMIENRPAEYCQKRTENNIISFRDTYIEGKSKRQETKLSTQDSIANPKLDCPPKKVISRTDADVQQFAGDNRFVQYFNLCAKDNGEQPDLSSRFFVNDYVWIIFLSFIGLVCLVLFLLLFASLLSSFLSYSKYKNKYKYKCEAQKSRYSRDIEIRKTAEKEAFYRSYFSCLNRGNNISVPLKSGQININQTIPEKGKN